jgi:hypothetical protein
MAFLVIPNEVQANRATVWVAAINETFDSASSRLDYGSNQLSLNAGWIDFATADGKNRIRYQRVILTNLSSRTPYNLALRVDGALKADGVVTTLPDRLPVVSERPFTVLLGSCYFGPEDKAGAVGQTYLQLPNDARPDLKILCGDQVYLDHPPQDFLNPFHSRDWLQARSFKTYADTWTQSTVGGGFQTLLKANANFFSSDDHEYWNNAPDRGFTVPLYAVSQGQRNTWFAIARELYQIFQTVPRPPITFKVGALSFCNAETRFYREPAHGNFMQPQDLHAIGAWLVSLNGPGVLVLGQPLFAKTGTIVDWGLPDFTQQYSQLVQYLRATQHTVVVLSGDVHFGRVAVANLRPELGTKLIEVISSPMHLASMGRSDYEPAPQVFGAVVSQPEFSLKRNHFLTLEFTAPSAQRASMLIRFWPIVKNGTPLQSQTIGNGPFELI